MESTMRDYLLERIEELDEQIIQKIEERKKCKMMLGMTVTFAHFGSEGINTPPTTVKPPESQNSGVSVDAETLRKVRADYESSTDTFRELKEMFSKLEICDLDTSLSEAEVRELLGRGSQAYINKVLRRLVRTQDFARIRIGKTYKYFMVKEGQEHI